MVMITMVLTNTYSRPMGKSSPPRTPTFLCLWDVVKGAECKPTSQGQVLTGIALFRAQAVFMPIVSRDSRTPCSQAGM